MICPCCPPENVNDLDSTFNKRMVQKDAASYLKKGLSARARKLVSYFSGQSNLSVLDIGCGTGSVHQDLLRHGIAQTAVGVDASTASLEAASDSSQALGLEKQTSYFHADFALQAESFEAADLVVLDRVICCYPHLQELFGTAVSHSNRFVALSYPVDAWWVHAAHRLADTFLTWRGSGYHPYVHAEQSINAIVEKAGFHLAHKNRHFLWEIRVFEK